jgi:hypothetical protein
MPADYAGARDAIRSRFETQWASRTPVAFVNERPVATFDGVNEPVSWVLFEIVNAGTHVETIGAAGNNAIVYSGMIKAHVFAPIALGTTDAYGLALAASEIFRNARFYDAVTAGCFVWSGYRMDGQPRVDEGEAASTDGQWFAVTGTVPFEYWHRA